MVLIMLLSGFLSTGPQMQVDSAPGQLGAQVHKGFIIPHAADLKAISQAKPVGVEVTYSRIPLSRAAYERCNCFARIGVYAHYFSFNNPTQLGRTYGVGGYIEPLIRYGQPLYFSIRATTGLSYLTRIYDAQTNPSNTFFGSPISGLLALSVGAHHRITNHLHLSATFRYNHISNGGIRQPNRGMNFPTAGLGVVYTAHPIRFPNPARWPRPVVTRQFTGRITAFGSIRTLPSTTTLPEQAGWLWGVTATAGYRATRFHAFTGGLEFVNDGYIREQLRRGNLTVAHRQLGLLGGYEGWLGRYRFCMHVGWNLLQPDVWLGNRFFQRYQLLYTIRDRYQIGIGLRAKLNVAEGLDLRLGWQF